MKKQSNPYSVNCCTKCRKNLTIVADTLGYTVCADCSYLNVIGVHSVADYNNWLKK